MRLKSLVIKGFKSFADETEINFNENLIGIVGPNGSGKSNIVDAIRWVLGEQKTSELRLDAMADVIFNGTGDRKEGRVARVTLTFDNTLHILPLEFTEVSIARLLYRDGTSEYRLNNVPCRKKDITSLFIDSGIGSNSYAIISLHMVEDILTDNGQSRRRMLEQAAGISKYKMRKRETLSKLTATSEDLDRVEDLLFEIKKNMKAFERQARRTEQFNKLRQHYKTLSIAIANEEIKDKKARKENLLKDLTTTEKESVQLSAQVHQMEAALQKAKQAILVHEQSLNKDQQDFNRIIERLGQLENQKNLSNQKINSATSRIAVIDLSLEKLHTQRLEHQTAIQTLQQQLTKSTKTYADLEDTFNASVETNKKAVDAYNGLRQRERLLKEDRQSLESQRSSLNAEIQRTTAKIQLYKDTIANNERQRQQQIQAIEEKQQQLIQVQQQATHVEADLLAASEGQKGATNQLNEHQTALNALIQDRGRTDLRIADIKQRLGFLENIVNKQEGIPESVKFLRQNSQADLPVLSDIVHVKDQKVTAVAELFFEPWMSSLITGKQADADDFYTQVRSAQKGKVHIFSMDSVPADPRPVKGGGQDNVIPLLEYLEITEPYERLVSHISRNAFISRVPYRDFDRASLIEGQIVLFPDDYLMISDSWSYGGSDTLFHGAQLGRKQLIEQLSLQLKKQMARLDQLDQDITTQRTVVEDHEKSLTQANKTLAAKQEEKEKVSRHIYELNSAISFQQNRLHTLVEEEKSKNEDVLESEKIIQALQSDLTALLPATGGEEEMAELAKQIEEAYAEVQTSHAAKEKHQEVFYGIRTQKDVLARDLEYKRNNAEQVKHQIEQFYTEQKEIKKNLDDFGAALQEVIAQLKKEADVKETIQAKLTEYQDTYYQEKGKIFESEKEISELRRSLAKKEAALQSLKDQLASINYDLQGIADRLQIEFGHSLKNELPVEPIEGSPAEWRHKMEKLREKISHFGEINPMAIDAYNEIVERHTHISAERDDIVEAKKSLEQTILEIEETAAQKFTEAVDAVRINFRNVFQGLFSEDDDCDIVILNPEDPLESNIEIIAKPKGKRPKSINLLSGGEKALTSASFLFALYLLKPAPFCIFDEVDAPLDDINIQKFNRLIRRFSDTSQFIIITHNKLTMAEVDVLYGVFLKEKGVSGVSAVDFRNYEAAEILEEPSQN